MRGINAQNLHLLREERQLFQRQRQIAIFRVALNVGVELGQLLFISFIMAVVAVAVYAAKRFSQWHVTPQSAFAWCENVSAYAIGGVAAFWLIERTLSFVT